MKILVCVKWVRDPDSLPRRDIESPGTLAGLGGGFRLNHFDAYAMEEAIRIKEGAPEAPPESRAPRSEPKAARGTLG